jgi:two-component system chemotaxis response regulator CheB
VVSYELVVIGASWGGLYAIEKLLQALPTGFTTPIAIAQHRAVDLGSGALLRMLSLRSGLEVHEAWDKQPVEQGHVYLAPPDYHLLLDADGFALSLDEPVQYSRPSIDVLFDSAADVFGDRLIGVVLTGANADGAYGLTRVKRRGGATIVQDPATAERAQMPAAAIATGAADHVLPLEAIAPKLAELVAA